MKNKNYLLKNLGIIISFAFFSCLFVYPFLKTGHFFLGDDIAYHFNRINELVYDIRHGNWYPYFYSHNFDKVNFPLGIFYPQITLIPFAVLVIVTGSYVKGIYFTYALIMFVALCLTFIVSKKVTKDNISSFFTAVIYGFSLYFSLNAYTRFDVGEFIAMAFLPLVLYGFYATLCGNYHDWPYLAFGLSFVMLTHVLSTFIDVLFMFIVFIGLIWQAKDKKKRIISFIKSVGVFLCSSAIFLIPFIEQELFQKFNKPNPTELGGTPLDKIITSMLDNSMTNGGTYTAGLIVLVIIILGIIFYKKLTKVNRFCLIAGIFLILCTSSVLPVFILNKTFISVIQFMFRLLGMSTFLLAVVGGQIASILINRNNRNARKKLLLITLMTIVIICPWYSSVHIHKQATPILLKKDYFQTDPPYATAWYLNQYMPAKSMHIFKNIKKHVALADNKKIKLSESKNIKSINNGIIFKSRKFNKIHKLSLPVPVYANEKVKLNNKSINFNISKQHTIQLSNVNLTKNSQIKIYYRMSMFDKLGIILSLLTWIIGICWLIKHKLMN